MLQQFVSIMKLFNSWIKTCKSNRNCPDEKDKTSSNEKKRSERRKHCARAGCSKVRKPPTTNTSTKTPPQTGPITIHCVACSVKKTVPSACCLHYPGLVAFWRKQRGLRGLLCRWPSITEWEMFITAQGCRLRNDLYCVEWDVKLYYTIPLSILTAISPLFLHFVGKPVPKYVHSGFYWCEGWWRWWRQLEL